MTTSIKRWSYRTKKVNKWPAYCRFRVRSSFPRLSPKFVSSDEKLSIASQLNLFKDEEEQCWDRTGIVFLWMRNEFRFYRRLCSFITWGFPYSLLISNYQDSVQCFKWYTTVSNSNGFFCPLLFIGPEGAFKKLKSESTSLGGVGPGGGSNSCVGNSHLHNPTAAACPTPARRRHRTTFTQVKQPNSFRFHFYESVFCATIHRILCLIENFCQRVRPV